MSENMDSPLITFSVIVNHDLLSGYYLSPNGFLRDIFFCILDLCLCLATASLQNVLPESFPELPLFPAVCLTTMFAMRRSALRAYFLAFTTGLLLDAGAFNPIGMSSLLCLFSAFLARLTAGFTERLGLMPQWTAVGFISNAAWVLPRLLFCAKDMPFPVRFSLMPSQVLLSSALAAFSILPFMLSIHDLISRAIPKRE